MDREPGSLSDFVPDYDTPIPYIQRTRAYYAAIGYTTPYRWAHNIAAPFAPAAGTFAPAFSRALPMLARAGLLWRGGRTAFGDRNALTDQLFDGS